MRSKGQAYYQGQNVCGIYPSSIYAWRSVSKTYVDFYEDDSSVSEKLFWVQSDKLQDFEGLLEKLLAKKCSILYAKLYSCK